MRNRKVFIKAIMSFGLFLAIAGIMFLIYLNTKPQIINGTKKIVIQVLIPKENAQEITLKTEAQYLGQALEEAKLIKGTEGEYGLFITEVNGRKADDSNQEWWCITKDGEDVYTGADSTPIVDGDHFELTLKNSY